MKKILLIFSLILTLASCAQTPIRISAWPRAPFVDPSALFIISQDSTHLGGLPTKTYSLNIGQLGAYLGVSISPPTLNSVLSNGNRSFQNSLRLYVASLGSSSYTVRLENDTVNGTGSIFLQGGMKHNRNSALNLQGENLGFRSAIIEGDDTMGNFIQDVFPADLHGHNYVQRRPHGDGYYALTSDSSGAVTGGTNYWTNDGSATWLTDPTQYLGIGNTNPLGKLDVTGSIWNSAYVGGPPSLLTNNYSYTFLSSNINGLMQMDTFGNINIQSTNSSISLYQNSREFNINADTTTLPDTYGGASIGWVETDIDGHGHMQRVPPSGGTLQSVTDAGNTTTNSITIQGVTLSGSSGSIFLTPIGSANATIEADSNGSMYVTNAATGSQTFYVNNNGSGGFQDPYGAGRQLFSWYNDGSISISKPNGLSFGMIHADSIGANTSYQLPNGNGDIALCNHGPTGSEPSTPYLGQFYFDTTLVKMKFWNGTSWAIITSTP